MRIPEVFYRVEERRGGEWVLLAELPAKEYSRPGQRFNAHERAKGEACRLLWEGEAPRRVLAPDRSLVAEVRFPGED